MKELERYMYCSGMSSWCGPGLCLQSANKNLHYQCRKYELSPTENRVNETLLLTSSTMFFYDHFIYSKY